MCKVNLFLIGAAKSGTSSLYDALCSSTDVSGAINPIDKEPAFFSDLKRGAIDLTDYHGKFNFRRNTKYYLDGSTAYISDPSSAKNIHEYNDAARILAVLRNPIERGISLYHWMASEGYEYRSMKKAVLVDELRGRKFTCQSLYPEYTMNHYYLRSGKYYQQLMRYIEKFEENFRFVTMHDLINDPIITMKKIERWLDISPSEIAFPSKNIGANAINEKVSFIARKLLNRFHKHQNYVSKQDRDWLIDVLKRRMNTESKFQDDLRNSEILNEYFHDELRILSGNLLSEYRL